MIVYIGLGINDHLNGCWLVIVCDVSILYITNRCPFRSSYFFFYIVKFYIFQPTRIPFLQYKYYTKTSIVSLAIFSILFFLYIKPNIFIFLSDNFDVFAMSALWQWSFCIYVTHTKAQSLCFSAVCYWCASYAFVVILISLNFVFSFYINFIELCFFCILILPETNKKKKLKR